FDHIISDARIAQAVAHDYPAGTVAGNDVACGSCGPAHGHKSNAPRQADTLLKLGYCCGPGRIRANEVALDQMSDATGPEIVSHGDTGNPISRNDIPRLWRQPPNRAVAWATIEENAVSSVAMRDRTGRISAKETAFDNDVAAIEDHDSGIGSAVNDEPA